MESAGVDRWGDLLAAAQTGDAAAYRRFLTEILPFIRALASRRAGSDAGVDDIVQDTLITVHRIRHTYQPGRPVKPWLAAIATRRTIDALRRQGRVARREVSDELAYETYADPEANKEEAEDSSRSLKRMTDDLSPGQKEAIILVKLKQLSLAEASAVSGQSVAALKVNIHRAIKKMRAMLAKGTTE
ncbi:MAG TPA: RNA polymerase sigma factor [Sphingomicrobium sp.]|nr:RNA polymerase sigma factor [Sphingomicrobium sp.]